MIRPTGNAISNTLQSIAPVAVNDVPRVGSTANVRRISTSPRALYLRSGYAIVRAAPASPIHKRSNPNPEK